MLKQIQRKAHFIRHLDARQVWSRCSLMAKRKSMVRLAALFPELRSPSRQQPEPVAEDLPLPVFDSRQFARALPERRFELSFLNEARTFQTPFDWHAKELEHGTRLWKLHLHYMEFLEALSDDDFSIVVADWIGANRPYRAGYWLDSWNSYALSIRCVVWMQQLAARGDGLPDAVKQTMIHSLFEQLSFLENNLETDIGGNHLIKNIKALLWAGAFFAGNKADQWSRLGRNLLSAEIPRQFLSDGMHFERSPAYHNQVFADLMECFVVLAPEDATRQRLRGLLNRMARVSADLTHPDGAIPLFNDAGLTMTYSPRECLDAYEKIMADRPKPRLHVHYPDAGYFGLRGDSFLFLADCGPVGPDGLMAHAHGDILSFEWSVHDQRVIVDPGVFEYNPGRRRDASRSTREHNTVTVDGREQCDFYGSFRCGRRARAWVLEYRQTDNGFVLEGIHDGFANLKDSPRAVRRFEVAADEVAIHDRTTGGSGLSASGRYLLHPSCSVSVDGQRAVIRRGSIVVEVQCDQSLTAEPAVWWPDFGVEMETTRLKWDSRGPQSCKTNFRVTSH